MTCSYKINTNKYYLNLRCLHTFCNFNVFVHKRGHDSNMYHSPPIAKLNELGEHNNKLFKEQAQNDVSNNNVIAIKTIPANPIQVRCNLTKKDCDNKNLLSHLRSRISICKSLQTL